MIQADRLTRRQPEEPARKLGDETGPTDPKVDRPAAPNPLMDRLKKVDPKQAEKYRQRSGE
ncbi:MAG: ubiquitin-like protein UBact [Armatimonadetes bacterium]|nr:ubiquitin-like protein UBact [Armatimonadota bacterium]